MSDTALHMPEPVGKQWEWNASDAVYKVCRVGRRGSKTRFAFSAAVMGHGPGYLEQQPKFGGVLSGGDVVWICPTYSNLTTVLWREEIEPRMGHLPYCTLNKTLHDVEIRGLGSLMLRSGDRAAIDSIRGVGKRLKGVIVDEAAHMDLRGALQDVILPALLDNGGWLILMSTTNAAGDGGYDDSGAPQVPSYFNLLCQQIRAGERSKDWVEFYGTAYDNPTLDVAAIDALVKEYPPDSPKLKQEVFAELLSAGIGLALPNLCKDRHLVQKFRVPGHWTQFGAFDWGFNHPWVFGWYAVDEDGNVLKVDTIWGREDKPADIAKKILMSVPGVVNPRFIVHAGHDIKHEKGRAAGFEGPTIAEILRQHGINTIDADNRRVLGLDNFRRYTHFEEEWPTVGPDARHPLFVWMDTEGNRKSLAQCQLMQIDPKNLEDALKVNADQAGRGGDDFYEEVRYGLMSRPLTSKAIEVEPEAGKSLGYDYVAGRPRVRETGDQWLERQVSGHRVSVLAGRVGAHRRGTR